MKRSTWMVVGTAALCAALTPIVGPFTFYADVVPVLSPVLPKPDGVPSRAEASFNWKGFGMAWHWDQPITNGCATWFAADLMDRPYRSVEISAGRSGCSDSKEVVSRIMSQDYNVLAGEHNGSGEEPCPFTVADASLAKYAMMVAEIRNVTTGRMEREMLDNMEFRLQRTNGSELITYVGSGCRDALGDPPNLTSD